MAAVPASWAGPVCSSTVLKLLPQTGFGCKGTQHSWQLSVEGVGQLTGRIVNAMHVTRCDAFSIMVSVYVSSPELEMKTTAYGYAISAGMGRRHSLELLQGAQQACKHAPIPLGSRRIVAVSNFSRPLGNSRLRLLRSLQFRKL